MNIKGDFQSSADKAGPSLSAEDACLKLSEAILNRDMAGLKHLLHAEGVDPALHWQEGTFLHYAAKLQNSGAMRALLEAGADIHALDRHGRSVLRAAMEAESLECVEVSILGGADTCSRSFAPKDGRDMTDNGYAIYFDWDIALAIGRVSISFDLVHAARTKDIAWVKELLAEKRSKEAALNINVHDRFGRTALLWACEQGDEEMARLLLAHGAKAELARRRDAKTPMHLAAEDNHVGILAALREAGASFSVQDCVCQTPVDRAGECGSMAAQRLIEGWNRDDRARIVQAQTLSAGSVSVLPLLRPKMRSIK